MLKLNSDGSRNSKTVVSDVLRARQLQEGHSSSWSEVGVAIVT